MATALRGIYRSEGVQERMGLQSTELGDFRYWQRPRQAKVLMACGPLQARKEITSGLWLYAGPSALQPPPHT